MGRRTVLLVAAVLVAVLGTVLVYAYVQNARTEAAAVNEPVLVLVTTTQIPAGTTAQSALDSGAIVTATVPRTAAGSGALSTIDSIATLVALYPIFPGQQIISSQWGSSAATGSLEIPEDRIAASFQLGDPQRVAGFVNPGSEVGIFVTLADPEQTKLLLSRITVIAVGPSTVQTRTTGTPTGQQNTEQIPTAILTLALTQAEMQKMVFASSAASVKGIWFGLLSKESKVEPGAGTTLGTLFS